jgi:hypothetical protein
MQALAPPHVTVESGNCHSICGQGPVVTNTASSHTITRRVLANSDKLLQLLLLFDESSSEESNDNDDEKEEEELDSSVVPTVLLQGYDLVQQGHKALEKKLYAEALKYYEQGMALASDVALQRQAIRNNLLAAIKDDPSTDTNGTVSSHDDTSLVAWLVLAQCGVTQARLATKDVAGALASAQLAWEWSQHTHLPALELLIQIYRLLKQHSDEYQAIEQYLTLTTSNRQDDELVNRKRQASPPLLSMPLVLVTKQQQQKERDRVAMVVRELGFRKAKLQRDANVS